MAPICMGLWKFPRKFLASVMGPTSSTPPHSLVYPSVHANKIVSCESDHQKEARGEGVNPDGEGQRGERTSQVRVNRSSRAAVIIGSAAQYEEGSSKLPKSPRNPKGKRRGVEEG